MGHVQRSVVVNAPPEEVFGLQVDTDRYGEWVDHFAGLDGEPAALAEGDSFRWRMKLWKLAFRLRSTVAALDPPHRYQEEIRGLVRGALTKTVSPQKRRTQLSWTLNYRVPGGPFGVAVDWLIAHRLADRAVLHSLQGAKRVLEAPKKPATQRGGYRRQTAVR